MEAEADAIVDAGIESVAIRAVMTCQSRTGICAKCYGRNLATGEEVNIGEAVGIIAAQSVGEPGTQLTMRNFHTGGVSTANDITTGLPRVQELFEVRRPKGVAILSEVSGKVSVNKIDKLDEVVVHSADGDVSYVLPYGSDLLVKEGDEVAPGTQLTAGSIYPNDILTTQGMRKVQDYLISEISNVYARQDVDINTKHLEVIIRQMCRKVQIEDSGDTDLLPGDYVDINTFEDENMKALSEGRVPASAKPLLLSITKASLNTESFLSAASFQETSAVLTDASIKGKVDFLKGIKENVMIGKLIPAGTGIKKYRDLMPKQINKVFEEHDASVLNSTDFE